jgi:hypothetical protein
VLEERSTSRTAKIITGPNSMNSLLAQLLTGQANRNSKSVMNRYKTEDYPSQNANDVNQHFHIIMIITFSHQWS